MLDIQNLSYSYKQRPALKGVSFSVNDREIFGLLGPNGSGKTTLFRILTTSLAMASGNVVVNGLDLSKNPERVREQIGVVFQSPSLDPKLTVWENLIHQGHLYGLSGLLLKCRVEEMLSRLGLPDRKKEWAGSLSGGLKRRVELAKGLLHRPRLLLLDEPSAGLDPGARIDLWKYLKNLREKEGLMILATTHLMEEADHCDRLAILNEGGLVALGSPEGLRKTVGGDVLVVKAAEPDGLAEEIENRFRIKVLRVNRHLQLEHERGARFVTELVEAFPGAIESVTFRKPTLEDVFIHHTGHKFWEEKE